MNIETESEFKKDFIDLINLFYGDRTPPFSISHKEIILGSEIRNVFILKNGKERKYEKAYILKADLSERKSKSIRKRYAKNLLYNVLCEETKTTLPWGSLTGVHPTKVARDMIESGECKPYLLVESLVKEYGVSYEKARLVQKILSNQRCIIRNDKLVNLYINIPICPTRCLYCSFISSEYKKVEKNIDTYLECVLKELEAVKRMIQDNSYIIRTIYVGGGTPTILTCEQLDVLLANLSYPVSEFTVECGRPDTITKEKLEVLKKHNVTRISINPQTFCESTLKRIGRNHKNEDVLRAYKIASEMGFNINMDIIAGLPMEKLGIFKRTMSKVLEFYPENVTVHTLSIKKGAELCQQKNEFEFSNVNAMIEYASKVLGENGYEPYYVYRQKNQLGGLENVGYFRDKKPCLFNIDSMEDITSIIGIGAGAISKRVYNIENKIVREPNCKFIEDYIARIDEMIEKKIKFFS